MKCKKFEDTNLVTGEVTYLNARLMREEKCGKEGILFEENNYKIVTVPYYFVKKHLFTLLCSGLIFFYCLLSLQIRPR
jgi:hypothetical protein